MLLEGRVALITGASRGIGAAIARAYAAEGATLLLCARGEGVETLAAELSQQQRPARAMRGDLNDPGFARDLIASARKEHGRLDVLVNNAGILRQGLIGMTIGRADAGDAGCQRARGHGAHSVRDPGHGFAAVSQHREPGLDCRYPRHGRCHRLLGIQGGSGGLHPVELPRSWRRRASGSTPSHPVSSTPRWSAGSRPTGTSAGSRAFAWAASALPEDVAGVAVFLASDLARYVTGQVIGVDGGMTS